MYGRPVIEPLPASFWIELRKNENRRKRTRRRTLYVVRSSGRAWRLDGFKGNERDARTFYAKSYGAAWFALRQPSGRVYVFSADADADSRPKYHVPPDSLRIVHAAIRELDARTRPRLYRGTDGLCLIDAHGAGHGLSVYVSGKMVTVKEWAEPCEPDSQGRLIPWTHSATVELDALLAPGAKHAGAYGGGEDGLIERVLSLAISWLAYYGGETEELDADAKPCSEFLMHWSRDSYSRRAQRAPIACELCGEAS